MRIGGSSYRIGVILLGVVFAACGDVAPTGLSDSTAVEDAAIPQGDAPGMVDAPAGIDASSAEASALLDGPPAADLAQGSSTEIGVAPDAVAGLDLAALPGDAPRLSDLSAGAADLVGAKPVDLLYNPPLDSDGVTCGNQTCTGGTKCCVTVVNMMFMGTCMDTCPGSTDTVACDGPDDCMGNPCCATITNGNVRSVLCASQRADCPPAINQTTRSGMDRLCHSDQDCTNGAPGTAYPTCCSLQQNGQSVHVCLSPFLAGFLGGSCP